MPCVVIGALPDTDHLVDAKRLHLRAEICPRFIIEFHVPRDKPRHARFRIGADAALQLRDTVHLLLRQVEQRHCTLFPLPDARQFRCQCVRCVIIHFHLNFRTGIGGHRGCPNGIRALHGDNFLRRAGIRPCAIVVPVVVLAFLADLRRQEALVRVEVVNPLQQLFRLCAGG